MATGKMRVGGVFKVWCYAPNGSLRWYDEAKNLVVDEGLRHLLDVLFNSADSAVSAVDPWYIGITNTTPTPAAGDTMSSHAGWTENTNYDEAARQAFNGVRSSQSVSNTASKASYTINTNSQNIGGMFLVSVSTKGGSTGTLLSCAPFSGGDKPANSGDTLQVEYTFSAADDGA